MISQEDWNALYCEVYEIFRRRLKSQSPIPEHKKYDCFGSYNYWNCHETQCSQEEQCHTAKLNTDKIEELPKP